MKTKTLTMMLGFMLIALSGASLSLSIYIGNAVMIISNLFLSVVLIVYGGWLLATGADLFETGGEI